MTLQNGMTAGGKAYLWTDTAYFEQDGHTLAGFGPKVMYGQEWPYAMSWTTIGGATGPQTMADRVAIARPAGLHELLSICETALREFCAKPGAIGRLLVAAWDRSSNSARMFLLRNEAAGGEQAFTPIELTGYVSSHNDSPPARLLAERGFTTGRVMAMIDLQQRQPASTILGDATCRIGGDCVQVEVSRDGVLIGVAKELADPQGALAA